MIIEGTIKNIKEYDPPIHIVRKHMNEMWLFKITVIGTNGVKYRVYETLDTLNVTDYEEGDSIKWDVDLFGKKDVRGCVEDMQV